MIHNNDFDKEWINLHKSLTDLESTTNDSIIHNHINEIDIILKKLEEYLDSNYHFKLRM
jgi:hypothetical protein